MGLQRAVLTNQWSEEHGKVDEGVEPARVQPVECEPRCVQVVPAGRRRGKKKKREEEDEGKIRFLTSKYQQAHIAPRSFLSLLASVGC